MASQFHVYLPCLGACLAWCLKCESTSRHSQPVEGPSGAFFVIVITGGLFAALLQVEEYVATLNSLESRRGKKPLDINNVIYWFKNTRQTCKQCLTMFGM